LYFIHKHFYVIGVCSGFADLQATIWNNSSGFIEKADDFSDYPALVACVFAYADL